MVVVGGSTLDCVLSRKSKKEDMEITFTLNPGTGESCGNAYLRQPIRDNIAKKALKKGVEVCRSKMALKYVKVNDSNPPHLYSSSVIHNAKPQYKSKQYIHQDPIKFLEMLKESDHINAIRNIGQSPFFVEYWTSEQIQAYKKLQKLYGASISIDATGFSIAEIKRYFGNAKKPILMYVVTSNTPHGQFSLAQKLSEGQTTIDTIHFLLNWLEQCGSLPLEVICDESRALLNGCAKGLWALITQMIMQTIYIR